MNTQLAPETPGRRGAAVFGEAIACGYVLGGLGGALVGVVLSTQWAGLNLGVWLLAAMYAGGFASAAGLLVGFLVGTVLGLVVSGCERRLGPARVARVIPAIALSMTTPLAIVFGLIGGTGWMLAIVVLDASFTFAGARLLAYRYLRRAQTAHLH
jgi:hypothetical protein